MNRITLLSLICSILSIATVDARSVHRTKSEPLPTVTTHWLDDDSCSFVAKSSHYEEYPIFKIFDHDFFMRHILPTTIAPRYNPEKTVKGEELSACIEQLLTEIAQKKKTYTHFDLLTKKNFNRSKQCGLMILKFKNYPFVLKLFIETPETFLNSTCKGLDNVWFHSMSAGVNRHMMGFTRVQNRETISEFIKSRPRWNAIFGELPRKWFWLPKETPWIEICGENIGVNGSCHTVIPGTYAIIADAVSAEKKLTMFNTHSYSSLTMEFCSDIHLLLDPHIDNFMIEKGTGKMVIIDSEHFPTLVGLKDRNYPTNFNSYFSWYRYLAGKFCYETFFRTKKVRKKEQLQPHARPAGTPLWF